MSPVAPFPLAAAWWRQHHIAARLQHFRASKFLTSSRRATDELQSSSSPLSNQPVVLISACLLGHPVTYRGAQVRLPATLRPSPLLFFTEVVVGELGLVRCRPLCPEMQWLGLPAPRPPLRLVRANGDGERETPGEELRGNIVCVRSGPASLLSFNASTDRLPPSLVDLLGLPLEDVDGVVLKSRSPSCGVGDARLYASEPTKTEGGLSCSSCRGVAACATTSASPSYALVDGFFTQLLCNSLHPQRGEHNPAVGEHRPSSPVSPPVITSDRLLRHFSAADSSDGAHVAQSSLEGFMDSVLRHHEQRLLHKRESEGVRVS